MLSRMMSWAPVIPTRRPRSSRSISAPGSSNSAISWIRACRHSPWGPGRLDAFGMIFNRVAGRDLGITGNFKIADARSAIRSCGTRRGRTTPSGTAVFPTGSTSRRSDATPARCSACSRISSPSRLVPPTKVSPAVKDTRTIRGFRRAADVGGEDRRAASRRRGRAISSGSTRRSRAGASRCSTPSAAAVTRSSNRPMSSGPGRRRSRRSAPTRRWRSTPSACPIQDSWPARCCRRRRSAPRSANPAATARRARQRGGGEPARRGLQLPAVRRRQRSLTAACGARSVGTSANLLPSEKPRCAARPKALRCCQGSRPS